MIIFKVFITHIIPKTHIYKNFLFIFNFFNHILSLILMIIKII